ncbi:DUF637 domain-containing protein, partial [Pseudomonas sp. 008]|uniref:DUF637 domain-containing protein n=1 Tax=Pseudomonas sp. 008 TaxID=2803906 RepID=UPI0019529111
AVDNLTISSAADEEHSLSKSKKLTVQEDHVSQVMSGVTAGGNVKLDAGKDLAVISSRISAGDEAYLVAGDKLDLLAAKDSDYSLYDMKKKGSFGAKKTKRDEVTDVKYIGSEISTGGNLTLASGGDQRYQVAKLESGKDITLDSGGSITFEAVKDLHDESHTKSDGDAFWTSSKGKGNTDETLRQTQMIAKGNITIKAVEGLRIDLKEVNQQSVSQTIDAMVNADPQLAWLKQAEARGDVDWKLVKEIHESFKYQNSGLGPASQLIIAIVMAAFVGPAALSAFASMGTIGAAGLAAVASGAATNAATSFINNGGNLGAVFQDVTSSEALKGYVISGVTAGLTAGFFKDILKTTTNPLTNKVTIDLSSLEGIGRFGVNQVLQGGTSALLGKALGQEGSVSDVLKTALFNTLAAASFNAVGDFTKGVADGSPTKVVIHAMVGGLLSEVTGGDFATGALAAGANEALIVDLNKLVGGNPDLLSMASQIVGVLAASTTGDVDAGTLQTGAWVANNATLYNFQAHFDEFQEKYEACSKDSSGVGCSTILKMVGERSQNLGNVILNTDADSNAVSYTLLDESSKPWMIMEPAEYNAWVTLPTEMQDAFKYSTQWQLDLSSTLLYANKGEGAKALESYGMMLSEPEYWGQMAVALMLSAAGGVGAFRGIGGTGAVANAERGVLAEANFAQNTIRSDRSFSPDGVKLYSALAGKPIKTVEDLAGALKTGAITPNQLPLDYVEINGTRLILNTRTSTALEQAGIPRSQWFGRNQTNVEAYPGKTFNDLAKDQLKNNHLPSTGADQLKSVRP